MKNFLLAICLVCLLAAPLGQARAAAPLPAAAIPLVAPGQQTGPAPQVANYAIDVTLDPATHQLAGQAHITYLNTTQEPIPDLVFHLYLNAFRNLESIFMREAGPLHRGFAWDANYPGWIEVSDLRLADGAELALQEIEDGTLARADLPQPVAPGERVALDLTFTAQLPKVFARTGFSGDFYMVGQWFPKLGVWEEGAGNAGAGNASAGNAGAGNAGAWNAHPFHANSEFYADFGVYDVAIHLPQGWVTGATGLPAGQTNNPDGTQTVRYQAVGVIDFAWTAAPDFRQAVRQVDGVELVYLYMPEHAWTVERVLEIGEASLRSYGAWYGPYPYPRLTVVDVPDDAEGAGGMEYPSLVTVGTMSMLGGGSLAGRLGVERSLELVTAHEIGHQWWQSVVAFNEAEEPWLDEGFTDYSAARLLLEAFPADGSALDAGGFEVDYVDLRRMEYLMVPRLPMYGTAWSFDTLQYGIATYSKPTLALLTLERVLGKETMLAVMSTFFERYRFAHPTTEDFRRVAEEVSPQDLDWFFDGLVYSERVLNYTVSAVEEHSFTVARQGDLVIPTEVLVTFADGSTHLEAWDGQAAEQTFTYPDRPALRSAEVDPERKLLVDLRWADNGLRRQPDLNAWLALFTRLVFQVQNALLGLGGL